ncbi:dioxygenase family protein [Aestuariibaculum sediminum]|uniref:Intradiol ring-cleavage dioxygenases domain-containing protein n=1 Tax=Aestuariibaculum sediminum TaxID=2770637 RepID=A0A8J6PZD3_9FLAO|nr:hypothetical protein [Aestuariibaculum sediminum]MBD0831983.1 hypothetical protein [Aestuariibaculum sediminum]
MKALSTKFILFICLILAYQFQAQNTASILDDLPLNYEKTSPIYLLSDQLLDNEAQVPDYDNKPTKLKISGTIYQADGKTPAKDVILFIYQPDENGNYKMKRDANRNRYVYHRAWVKTNADGKYTFYTFMPGKYLKAKELKQIHRIIKEPGKPEQELSAFFFNDDPLIPDLTLACRAEAVKSMLRLEEKDDMLVATKDIVLKKSKDILTQ